MPTRFYMSNVAQPDGLTPSPDGGWEQTGQGDRAYSPRKGINAQLSALANQAAKTVPITTTQQIAARQFLTDPVPYPLRLTGTFSMVLRGLENATTNNVFLAYVLRVLSKDGATVRGTLASSMTNAGTEFAATAATRIFSAVALTPLNLEAGDRFCLEVGGHAQAPSAAGSFTYRFGVAQGADFALTSGLTTDLNPWWELSQDVWPILPANWRDQGRMR